MDYMKQALSLAELAMGQVSPNPAVGAVVVKDDKVIGQGYTQSPGSSHAEIVALKQAGKEARNGVLYVTLEPCCHYGLTPPCTQVIINAGITEVHIAILDVNPLVSGRGKDELESRGIKVYLGEHEEEASKIIEAYAKFITTGMPFVTVKYAMSLDGKIATKSGDSKWISGEASRKYVHNLRCVSDALMVGVNTVIFDNPRLTARCCGSKGGVARKQPLRVLLDTKGRIPLDSKIFKEPGEILMAVGQSVAPDKKILFIEAGVQLLELPVRGKGLDLEKLLKALGERKITSVVVEGGGILLGSLFDCKLVDKVIAFIAPIIIGGQEAKMAVCGEGVANVANSFNLKRISTEKFGSDLMVSGYIEG
ncbi:MAG: bifunctional diaminohydroxyphosphoribosylaminopyrimidine deaminase/5-amino-6-(5-phosphoribosylamino)uracil reductase RibD [Dehalococcoidales bacterium]|nr:bifunctional diaminohydroxyphosphoribosylaminopyrimidine deaminase/5-amino-6-(5-phosphoribosylamino)uracil reductase RibD [Dehalococcoidales bacterium]